MSIDWNEWRNIAEPIIAEVLGIPAAYIVLADECCMAAGEHWGTTWPGLASMLQPEVGERWRGPGPGMVLDPEAITRWLESQLVEDGGKVLIEMAWGVVAHEMAHWLEQPTLNVSPEADFTLEEYFEDIHRERASPRPVARLAIEHGPLFCWNCLHVLDRMRVLGLEACLVTAIDYEQFGLPRPAFVMRNAIRPQLRELEHVPLIAVSQMELPSQFQVLFASFERNEPMNLFPVTDFFTSLRARKDQLASENQLDWLTLVERIADHSPPSEDDVLKILKRLGKEPTDLEQAVQTLRRRRMLDRHITDAKALASELPQIERQLEQAASELTVARQRYDNTVHPLAVRREQIATAQRSAAVAEEELIRLAQGTELAQSIKATAAEIHALRQLNQNDSDTIDSLLSKLHAIEDELKREREHGLPIDSEKLAKATSLQAEIEAKRAVAAERNAEIKRKSDAEAADRLRLLEPTLIA